MTMERSLTRFLTKCLVEAYHHGADAVVFAQDGDALITRTVKNRSEVGLTKGEGVWFDPLWRWLADRASPLTEVASDSAIGTGESAEYRVEVALREISRYATAIVKRHTTLKGSRTCTLSRVEFSSLQSYADHFDTSGEQGKGVDALLQSGSGIIGVISPTEEHLRRLLATILSHSALTRVIPLAQFNTGAAEEWVRNGELVIVTTTGLDPVGVFIQMQNLILATNTAPQFRGVLCGAIVPRVCDGCGRDAQIDSSIVKQLPVSLKAVPVTRYMVGRGCTSCNNTGYRGVLGLYSAALNTWISPDSSGRLDHGRCVGAVLNHGGRSLLEDGVRKAYSGYTTMETVVSVVRTLPPGWEAAYEKRVEVVSGGDAHLPDPFAGSSVGRVTAPEQGSGVFRKPNVAGNPATKRERPLILVAEDDGDQRDILEMVIRGAQYDVISAKDGADALTKIQNEMPDLIITDLMMPRMDGRELVAHVKSNPRTNQIPVMVLTVVSDVEKEYALLNCGAEEYCEKTVQRRILLKRVENLLKRQGAKP